MSDLSETLDVSTIRQVVSELTRKPVLPYQPGYHRRAYRCCYCKQIFSSGDLRAHVPRCALRYANRQKTYNERVLGATRLTPRDLSDEREREAMLGLGPQGAD